MKTLTRFIMIFGATIALSACDSCQFFDLLSGNWESTVYPGQNTQCITDPGKIGTYY